MLKCWPELTLFLKVAGAPLGNNICEQQILKSIKRYLILGFCIGLQSISLFFFKDKITQFFVILHDVGINPVGHVFNYFQERIV